MTTNIESSQNSIYKQLLSLTRSKGIKEHSMALVSGEKLTHEISQLTQVPLFWIHTEKMNPGPHFSSRKNIVLASELFKTLDVCGTNQPLLCVQTPKLRSFDRLHPNQATLYVALSDPNNLGALIRTCAAFSWPQIVLLKESAHPFLPKALRASSGTALAASLFTGPSIHDLIDVEIVALDGQGQALQKSDIKPHLKILIGEEGKGVPQNFPGKKIKIPISNKVESLNATIAASLIVYEWSQKS